MVIRLEPDILECEVKWALESIATNKASGGDGIPAELFQILKDDVVKVLHSICQQLWKTALVTRLEKLSFPSKHKERQCSKNVQTTVVLQSVNQDIFLAPDFHYCYREISFHGNCHPFETELSPLWLCC